jgi:hypothetical protein
MHPSSQAAVNNASCAPSPSAPGLTSLRCLILPNGKSTIFNIHFLKYPTGTPRAVNYAKTLPKSFLFAIHCNAPNFQPHKVTLAVPVPALLTVCRFAGWASVVQHGTGSRLLPLRGIPSRGVPSEEVPPGGLLQSLLAPMAAVVPGGPPGVGGSGLDFLVSRSNTDQSSSVTVSPSPLRHIIRDTSRFALKYSSPLLACEQP